MSRIPTFLSLCRVALGPLYAAAVAATLSAGDAWARPAPGAALARSALSARLALPLAIAVLASLTDFTDGRLARRLQASSPRGAALDVAADAVFVLCALFSLAVAGALSAALPLAAAASLGALLWRRSRRGWGAAASGDPRPAADAIGHIAGILNYSAILLASGVPLGLVDPGSLLPASDALALVNLIPLALRGLER